jgi:REP-associated tyrosine transposase
MPKGLKRYYGEGHLHFITFSCYRRQQFLTTARRRDCFLEVLEHTRQRYHFWVVGYVVMPEHVHLLISESKFADPSTVVRVLKQRVARRLLCTRRKRAGQLELFGPPRQFWQKRFYDFNVFTAKKRIEKLKYMHRNPVKRGLVPSPELWRWSSFNFYASESVYIVNVEPVP